MVNEIGKYGVEFTEAHKGWASEEEENKYTHLGAFNSVGVRFDTIEDAETLIHMVHLDELPNVWAIVEYEGQGGYSNKYAKIHPLVEEIWAKEKSDKETNIAHNTALTKAINKQPTKKLYKRYPKGTTITLERSGAEYNPKQSGKIQMGIRVFVKLTDKEPFDLWLNSFITRDGKAQKAKFLNNKANDFGGQSKERVHYTRHGHYGENREGIYPDDMRAIADDLLNIREAIKDWERELYNLKY